MQIVMPITRSRAAVLHRSIAISYRLIFQLPRIGRNIVGAKCIVGENARQQGELATFGQSPTSEPGYSHRFRD